MNEQANKILVDLLQKASNGIDAAVSFSQAQVPDVIHQLLVWSSVQSALFQVFGLLFLIGAMKLPGFARRARKNGENGLLTTATQMTGGLSHPFHTMRALWQCQ